MKLLTQRAIFQQQATLNLECRYYLISILVEGLLSDVKKRIEENAIQVATQFFGVKNICPTNCRQLV